MSLRRMTGPAKEQTSSSQGEKLIVLAVGDSLLAFPLSHVVEIADTPPLRRVPLTVPRFLGYAKWRDGILPVLDIERDAGDEGDEGRTGVRQKIVILSAVGERFAIAADRILGIGYPFGPVRKSTAGRTQPYVKGKVRVQGGHEALLMDANSFWEEELA
jgi:chemotaxis signal transduction protein